MLVLDNICIEAKAGPPCVRPPQARRQEGAGARPGGRILRCRARCVQGRAGCEEEGGQIEARPTQDQVIITFPHFSSAVCMVFTCCSDMTETEIEPTDAVTVPKKTTKKEAETAFGPKANE